MPVNETLWLRDQLRVDGLELAAVFANALLPDRFTEAQARRVRSAHERGGTGADGALAAALSEHARAAAQRDELARLREGLGAGVPGVELPFLFSETLGVPELLGLADALEQIA
jgi:hypothetical protein